ncbi:hypothetical protein B0G74_3795 [Paraburkholderia sp. BL9I2N2]|nr:hypothetical protein B0G74_3795 [Paraburkholderia sp. BL9I2N2]
MVRWRDFSRAELVVSTGSPAAQAFLLRTLFRSKKKPSPLESQLLSASARYFLRAVSAVSDKSTSRISLFNVSSLIS